MHSTLIPYANYDLMPYGNYASTSILMLNHLRPPGLPSATTILRPHLFEPLRIRHTRRPEATPMSCHLRNLDNHETMMVRPHLYHYLRLWPLIHYNEKPTPNPRLCHPLRHSSTPKPRPSVTWCLVILKHQLCDPIRISYQPRTPVPPIIESAQFSRWIS
jgi:hypothetical protein